MATVSRTLLCQLAPVRCSSSSLSVRGALGMASSRGEASHVLSCRDCRLVRLRRLSSPLSLQPPSLPPTGRLPLAMEVNASLCSSSTGVLHVSG